MVYLPVFQLETSPGEPNNSCEQAYTISTGNIHQFYPNDAVDWYQFRTNNNGSLSVHLTDFIPLAGQVAVYRGSNCSDIIFLGSNGDFNRTKIVNLSIQPAGNYYIFLSNDGNFNDSNPYFLQVRLLPQFKFEEF
jgi:hypothetical protein